MGTDGSIGYRVTPLGAGEVGSRTLRIWKAKPDYTDITIDGTVWLGYFNGTDYDICRVNYCEDVLTRTWVTGAWDDRYTLLPFCGYTTTTTAAPVTTTTTTEAPFFMMKFDSLANADLMVGGDATDVADWNTFFDLPANGTPFDNIQIVGNTPTEITLYGGGNMTLSAYLFGDNEPTGTSLLEVEDNGVTVLCGDGVFSDFNIGTGCRGLIKIILPSLNINNTEKVFGDCDVLAELNIDFDAIIILGTSSFYYNISLPHYNFPNLLNIGESCFYSYIHLVDSLWMENIININIESFGLCTSLVNPPLNNSIISLPNNCFNGCSSLVSPDFCGQIQTLGSQVFAYCTSLVSPNFNQLVSVGDWCFANCTGLSSLNLSSCTDLGGTTGNNDVFNGITGKTITITIPHALESDGDIVWLKANNTVTVLYSD